MDNPYIYNTIDIVLKEVFEYFIYSQHQSFFSVSEYLRMKKHPSLLKACRITTQKLLYFLVFVASVLRGTYFAAPVR